MKVFISLLMLFMSLQATSKSKNSAGPVFEILPLNSPVSESVARFFFKVPSNFQIDKISYQVFGPRLFSNQVGKSKEVQLTTTSKGQELQIPVDGWKAGSYRLFVILKDKSKKEYKFEHKLQHTLRDYVPFAILPKPNGVQEPDPVKNNATLLGVDTDNNGIRDDIQLWIANKYKSSPVLLQAFNDYAVNIQSTFANKDNKDQSNFFKMQVLKAQGCIMNIFDEQGISFKDSVIATSQLRMLFTNTKSRIIALDQIDQNFHGLGMVVLSKEESCEF